ncbi:tRNA glutamyl-Q(34) synthetase GluQRS [Komagataeibacter nataicola]|uniref:tRNA glutamyl-Q(34) synthetase GluQRS n=1 Tax=Komagataeibacter nataicola TaxID=265960 RepID=A0A9N7C827_9PROT|nr:tRNA glutamyl-Q(34) synthetase GluQRS [Komagataeibacter nataicola]AQU86842.1 tRNA glutamyl-Q(34) synthetase GluQRS [Komagataeibacter nataicola]PYD67860.1 tRNA glutamyl-Q(34) synthetase GluQRS [Komagataeibacter nataicola]WEQ56206.1 tRNA glutamyl-Q(34) synthetase GluQRS [Komagataeibacter nataicola]GBR24241.1 glutamyl-tRNA synthetase [Komagataeibacter nataicola NRIC 0616]
MAEITRFAPSPTGHLHLGHVASVLHAWRAAMESGGRFILRVEDIDTTRCRPEFIADLYADLAWLGLSWPQPVRRQSQHMAAYRTALDRLAAHGLLYPCFCTRRDIAEAAGAPHHAPDGAVVYPGTCRHMDPALRAEKLAAGAPHALRLDMARALQWPGADVLTWHELGEGPQPANAAAFGDVVLARRDVPASYHLCVTHDDALQGITLVTRGADLRPATGLHRLLQHIMGWPAPRYSHHALLCDADGRRLAKRDGAPSIRSMRVAGMTPRQVCAAAERGNGISAVSSGTASL